jgi:adenylate cyclase
MLPGSIVRFGGFTLNVLRRCLYGPDGAELKLRPKSFDLLCHLVEHRGRVVTKDELVAAVWPTLVVTDDSVVQCIHDIRGVLGGEAQSIVRTVSRRGYLFAAEVVVVDEAGAAASSSARDPVAGLEPVAGGPPTVQRHAVPPTPDSIPARARGIMAGVAIVGCALLVMIAITAWAPIWSHSSKPVAGLRIAVLPLEALEPSTERHFGDGIAEDIITALSRFRDLTVLAGNSTFRYRGDVDMGQAAKALDADFIVRGSVAREQDRVRVNVQLVDAQSGATRWAERYERPLRSVFELQDEIADQVAAQLVGHAHYHGAERIRTRPPGTLDAYELVLKARQGFNTFTTASLAEAHALLQQATALDRGYAPAWDLLGRVLIRQYLHPGEWQFSPQTLQRSREALQTALSLDATLASSHGALGYVHLLQHDYDASLAALRHSIALNPNEAGNFRSYGDALFRAGEYRASLDAYHRSRRLDPFSPPQVAGLMGRAHLMLGEHEQGRALARECLDRGAIVPVCLMVAAATEAAAGRAAEAQATTQVLLHRYPKTTINRATRVFPLKDAAEQARWADYLRAAGVPE